MSLLQPAPEVRAARPEHFPGPPIEARRFAVPAGKARQRAAAVGRFRGEPGLEGEPVYIGSHEGTKAELVEGEVGAFIRRLQAVSERLDKLFPSGEELDRDGLEAVIELAAWTHSEWVRIHPFRNGNGRSARLLANAILMRYGLPPVLKLRPRPEWDARTE